MKRNVSLALAFLACQCIAVPVWAQQSQSARGVVFEDRNGNGKKERREPGIAGVGVSDGRQVVQTDKNGNYTLELEGDATIFVVKPSGYRFPLNELNQPQFYYIHKPEGSPELKYKGSHPTGPLPKSLDFALLKSEQPEENFKAYIFGDPQPYSLQQLSYFSKTFVNEVKGSTDAAFGLSLGDIVGDNLDLHAPYAKEVAKIGIPWLNLMGNHDMNYDAKEDRFADEAYEANLGPANYSFNHGKVHFIVLDDILYPDPRDGQGYWGGFRKDQLDFVENDLKLVPKDHLIVLAFHIPIFEEGDSFRDEDRERLLGLLKDFPNTMSLSAHTHFQRQEFFGSHHHYNVGTTSGDWYSGSFGADGTPASTMRDGTPKGYAIMTFEGNKYVVDYKVAGESLDYRMNIHAPRVVPHKSPYNGQIVVNYFLGGEKDVLDFRVDGGEWRPMKREDAPDPAFTAIHHEWDYSTTLPTGRRPSHPVLSSHIWKAPVPVNLPPGKHTIEVRVKDMFGRNFISSREYEIVTPAKVIE